VLVFRTASAPGIRAAGTSRLLPFRLLLLLLHVPQDIHRHAVSRAR